MNWLVKWGVKRYVVSIVNTALKDHAQSIATGRATVGRYIGKVKQLLLFLEKLDAALADNEITDDETTTLTNEAVALGKALAK